MNKLVIGLILGALIGAGVGYVLFNKEAAEPQADGGERGTWPEVPSPPDSTQFMVIQRLQEILTTNPPPPPHIITLVLQTAAEEHNEQTWPPRSMQVFQAWEAAKKNPPDWEACTNELEPDR